MTVDTYNMATRPEFGFDMPSQPIVRLPKMDARVVERICLTTGSPSIAEPAKIVAESIPSYNVGYVTAMHTPFSQLINVEPLGVIAESVPMFDIRFTSTTQTSLSQVLDVEPLKISSESVPIYDFGFITTTQVRLSPDTSNAPLEFSAESVPKNDFGFITTTQVCLSPDTSNAPLEFSAESVPKNDFGFITTTQVRLSPDTNDEPVQFSTDIVPVRHQPDVDPVAWLAAVSKKKSSSVTKKPECISNVTNHPEHISDSVSDTDHPLQYSTDVVPVRPQPDVDPVAWLAAVSKKKSSSVTKKPECISNITNHPEHISDSVSDTDHRTDVIPVRHQPDVDPVTWLAVVTKKKSSSVTKKPECISNVTSHTEYLSEHISDSVSVTIELGNVTNHTEHISDSVSDTDKPLQFITDVVPVRHQADVDPVAWLAAVNKKKSSSVTKKPQNGKVTSQNGHLPKNTGSSYASVLKGPQCISNADPIAWPAVVNKKKSTSVIKDSHGKVTGQKSHPSNDTGLTYASITKKKSSIVNVTTPNIRISDGFSSSNASRSSSRASSSSRSAASSCTDLSLPSIDVDDKVNLNNRNSWDFNTFPLWVEKHVPFGRDQLSITLAPLIESGWIPMRPLFSRFNPKALTSATFTCFPDLPTEIRVKIWKYALKNHNGYARISWSFEDRQPLIGKNGDFFVKSKFTTRNPQPPLASVNIESRMLALEHYQKVFSTIGYSPQTLFNFKQDELFIQTTESTTLLDFTRQFRDHERNQIQTLSVSLNEFIRDPNTFAHAISKFEGLKKLKLAVADIREDYSWAEEEKKKNWPRKVMQSLQMRWEWVSKHRKQIALPRYPQIEMAFLHGVEAYMFGITGRSCF